MWVAAIIALVGAIASVIASSQNKKAQEQTNQTNLDIANLGFEKERSTALEMWNLQNAYNHPSSQIERYKEAGLNPYMLANTMATPASAPNVPNYDTPRMDAPHVIDYGQAVNRGLTDYYSVVQADAQTSATRANTEVMRQEAAYKAGLTAESAARTARSQFDLDQAKELRQTSVDAAKANLRAINQKMELDIRADERAAATTSKSMEEAGERILSMREARANTIEERQNIRAQRDQIRADSRLKQLDAELRSKGVYPGDPLWMRLLIQNLPDILGTKKSVFPNTWQDGPVKRGAAELGGGAGYRAPSWRTLGNSDY